MAKLPDHFLGSPIGTERISREVLASHQRERVVELVTPVFARRGYPGTTLDDLLASGKVGVTNFYDLFESKEDCFFAACERAVGNARGRISAAIQGVAIWDERAYLGLAATLEFLLAEPLQARLVLIEAQSAGPEAIARYNALMDTAIAWLAAGRSAHSPARSLPQSFEQVVISGLAFYLQQCLLDSRRHTAAELLEETAGLVLEPIVGAGEMRRLRRDLTPTTA
jgi:AcrR family transcriptional regulator